MPDIEKGDLLRQLGYASDHEVLLAKLEEAGLTNARKARIAAAKTEAVVAALEGAFIKVCTGGDCQKRGRAAAKGRTLVKATAPSSCDICGGSAASPALEAMQKEQIPPARRWSSPNVAKALDPRGLVMVRLLRQSLCTQADA